MEFERDLVYIVQTAAGQLTLTPGEFPPGTTTIASVLNFVAVVHLGEQNNLVAKQFVNRIAARAGVAELQALMKWLRGQGRSRP